MSASGLPGSRVAAMRAGIRTTTDMREVGWGMASGLGVGIGQAGAWTAPLGHDLGMAAAKIVYTGCKARGKPAICAPPSSSAVEPFSDGFDRKKQDRRCACWEPACSWSPCISHRGRSLRRRWRPSPAMRSPSKPKGGPGESRGRAGRSADREPARQRVGRTWRRHRQAMPALPQPAEGPGQQGWPGPLWRGRAGASRRSRASHSRRP